MYYAFQWQEKIRITRQHTFYKLFNKSAVQIIYAYGKTPEEAKKKLLNIGRTIEELTTDERLRGFCRECGAAITRGIYIRFRPNIFGMSGYTRHSLYTKMCYMHKECYDKLLDKFKYSPKMVAYLYNKKPVNTMDKFPDFEFTFGKGQYRYYDNKNVYLKHDTHNNKTYVRFMRWATEDQIKESLFILGAIRRRSAVL